VLLCVPAPAMADAVAALRGLVHGSTVLADICSVKVRPLREMMNGYDGPVVGTHPLFGPEPAEGQPLRVAVTPGGGEGGAADRVEEWLSRIGFTPFRTTAKEHDQALALIQGLNFVTQLAYLATAADHPEIREFLTPSFQRRLDSARKMVIEDGEMFKAIFEANPFSQEAVRGFRSHLNLAAGGDVDLLLDKAGWWWRSSE
jgi:prephenate dehydrogenase